MAPGNPPSRLGASGHPPTPAIRVGQNGRPSQGAHFDQRFASPRRHSRSDPCGPCHALACSHRHACSGRGQVRTAVARIANPAPWVDRSMREMMPQKMTASAHASPATRATSSASPRHLLCLCRDRCGRCAPEPTFRQPLKASSIRPMRSLPRPRLLARLPCHTCHGRGRGPDRPPSRHRNLLMCATMSANSWADRSIRGITRSHPGSLLNSSGHKHDLIM